MAQSRGPARVPAGTKRAPTANGATRRIDPMDPNVPLEVDGARILADPKWAGAYLRFDMAAEMWLEMTSGRPISYFEPTAGRDRPIKDHLLWFVAGLRDWHRDGYEEHPWEDDLTIRDLEKVVTQRTMVAIGYVANKAWQISVPREMGERMAQQQREQAQPLIIAALRLGWPLDKALATAEVSLPTFLAWQVEHGPFRDAVRAAGAGLAPPAGMEAGEPGEGREGPEDGKSADPLAGAVGSGPGRSPGSSSDSPTESSGV